MRVAPAVTIDKWQRETLQQLVRSRSLPARQIERARIVLLAAEGKTDLQIAARLNISNQKAARWRKRFRQFALAGLVKDAPRPGRKPAIPAQLKAELIRRTTQSKPANATHWARVRWRLKWESARRRYAASGMPTASSLTWQRLSRSAQTNTSPRNWKTSGVSI